MTPHVAEASPSGSPLRLALCQLVVPLPTAQGDPRQLLLTSARVALASGADVVVLPELAVPGYTTVAEQLTPLAETIPGPTTRALEELAASTGAVIVAGLAEKSGTKLYNSAVVVGPEGILAHYRKLHLFGDEKKVFAPGNLGLPIAETDFGPIGVCMCYDLRFPEVVRLLALRGAELVCAPSAWVHGFDPRPGEIPGQVQGALVQANLNQVFIACASQVGRPGEHTFLGHSVVADPFGVPVLGPLGAEEPRIAAVGLDLAACQRARSRSSLVTPREDRRTDVYTITYDGQCL